jgi:sugar phosphate permease
MRLRQPNIFAFRGRFRTMPFSQPFTDFRSKLAAYCGRSMLRPTIKDHKLSQEETMPDTVEQSTVRKVYWRLLPLAILTYFLCYLDRINVGFAALTMNKDLGLDAATYGMAAGAFFWGYFLFEVPSNLVLEKVGARLWIARIMVTWGLLSGATAFCVGPWSFLTMRFLLGLAEAGLFPGMILVSGLAPRSHHGGLHGRAAAGGRGRRPAFDGASRA